MSAWAVDESVEDPARRDTAATDPVTDFDGVSLLRWPSERGRARALEALGRPFLALVAEGEDPPVSGYPLTDWVRSPIDAEELVVRRATLERRFLTGRSAPRPCLDADGCLVYRGRAVDVSPSQAAALGLLVDAFGDVVPNAALRTAFALPEGCHGEAFRARVVRLRRRVQLVGLDLRRANHAGYALEPATGRSQ